MYIVSPNDRQSGSEDEEAEQGSAAENGMSSGGTWTPTFTQHNPERVVLSRAAALAKRSHDFLMEALLSNHDVDWSAVFLETPSSFMSYSALLRVDSDFVVDKECSSTGSEIGIYPSKDGVLESSYTRSMRQRSLGPKALRRKVYRNLSNLEDDVVLVSLFLATLSNLILLICQPHALFVNASPARLEAGRGSCTVASREVWLGCSILLQ
jgi:hypothetical protein